MFSFVGPILIRHNIYTVVFYFNLIKSRFRLRLGLELRVRVRVFADAYYRITHYYYTVQLYWNGLLLKTRIVPGHRFRDVCDHDCAR